MKEKVWEAVLYNEELHDVYLSLNVVWVIKSVRMLRVEHVARAA
jgi:hypothetical protein